MGLETTVDLFRMRFALPLELLQQVLRDYGMPLGSLASIEPFAAEVSRPGTLADSMASALGSLMDAEPAKLTRMELLELLCIAVSGSDVESSGPALRRPLRQILVFVNGVLLSRQEADRESAGDETAEEQEKKDKRDWPRSADAAESMDLKLEKNAEVPENFYILESFHFGSLNAPAFSTAPSVEVGTASSTSALEEPLQQFETTPDQHRVNEPAQGEVLLTTDVCTSAAPAALNLLKPAPQHLVSKAEGLARANLHSWPKDTAFAGEALPEAKTASFLSRPAMIACALVLGFAGGMLVPRFTPKSHATRVVAERPGELPQTADAKARDAALNDERLRLAAMLNPSPSRPSAVAPKVADQASAVPPVRQAGLPSGSAEQPTQLQAASHSGAAGAVHDSSSGPHVVPNTALDNLVYSPQPLYPTLAQLTHAEGDVVLAITVAIDGSVVSTRVVQGPPLLRGAAEAAVRHWRFHPFVKDGRPTQVETSVVVNVRPPL